MKNPEHSGFREGVAIIGMAGRFPGAGNITEFWKNLCDGVEAVRAFTPEELASEGTDPEQLQNPNYVNAGIILEESDSFDATFFGYKPREVELMDPQHRIFLECAWSALEHAGYDPEEYDGAIGVFGGVARNNYLLNNLIPHKELMESAGMHQTIISNDKDFPATRVSFKLNLRGPSINVQTACSSSGVAIHLACQSLISGECDIALAGGARVRIPMKAGYIYEEGGIQSPDGHCRAFDANARGTVLGSGVGIIVLKRLSEALEDGDAIYAVIKGTAINNDGASKVGFTAPSVEGQAMAIAEAQAIAGISADTISYVEAHGTGTSLGDPIEITALTKAFRESTSRNGFCAIGAVKTNIGHLDAGAGVTGVIKTALALKHKLLPSSLNFEKPNPQIDFASSPFYVNTRLTEWKTSNVPRRAGVSSFGLGGTNAHIVLEEAPDVEASSASRGQQLIVLSAKTETALEKTTENLAAFLAANPEVNFADVAHTLQTGRRSFNHRRILVCRGTEEAVEALRQRDQKKVISRVTEASDPKIVFMFPGQGTQQVNMGRELYETEPAFRTEIDRCAEILRPLLGIDLRQVIYPAPDAEEQAKLQLKQTALAQTSLFTVCFAMTKLWKEWGINPEEIIGHSVGEYVAACLAEVFTLEEALGMLAWRGRMMQELPAGGMLAVSLSEAEASKYLGSELSLAAVNSPSSCVISGPTEALNRLEEQLRNQRIACRPLQTSHAFHSAMVDPIIERFTDKLKTLKLRAPRIPFISSCTGTWITAEQAIDPNYWGRHMRETVRFASGLQEVIQRPGRILLEVGPGSILSSLAKHFSYKGKAEAVIASLGQGSGGVVALLNAFGQLWLSGVRVNWSGFRTRESRQKVGLPTYPFERKRFWIDPPRKTNIPIVDVSSSVNLDAGISSNGLELSQVDQEESVNRSFSFVDGAAIVKVDRRKQLIEEMKLILHGLSGVDVDELGPSATFVGMGFDSLFLTQVGSAFYKKFDVKVTLRHLIDEYPSLEALAGYIDSVLPSEKINSNISENERVASEEPDDVSSGSKGDTADSMAVIEKLLTQQMQLASEQLKLVRGRIEKTFPGTNKAAKSSTKRARNEAVSQNGEGRFGPYKPIDRDASGHLSPAQQNALHKLIQSYNAKTRESKRLTECHRPHLADPRTISGFKLQWKEMVYPIVASRSSGSKLWDADGNEYIDFTMGYGIHLFGHSPVFVTRALTEQLELGVHIGPQSALAGEVARMVRDMTGMERVTFCNTGSEAVLAALRVARTVTGKSRIAFFSGSYHGINDEVLVRENTVNGTRHQFPVAPGIMPSVTQNALVLKYGDAESLEIIREHADELAAVIVEPVQSRRPDWQPQNFLVQLREVTGQSEIALIFDEVITGFRLQPGGAQAWYGVKADLATYGKVIGGGLPMGAVAGSAKFMDAFDGGKWTYGDGSVPEAGITFFAGTFVRHPLALSSAAAVLNHLKERGSQLQDDLNKKSDWLANELNTHFQQMGAPIRVVNCGSIFYFRFENDNGLGNLLFYYLRLNGIFIWEGRPCFLSTAHSDEDIRQIIEAFKESVAEMQSNGFWSSKSPPINGQASMNLAQSTGEDIERQEVRRLPLTAAQMEVWLESQKGDHASCHYNESHNLWLRGDLNVIAVKQAIQELSDRHEALRTVFHPQGEYQEIRSQVELEIPLIDLTSLDRTEQEIRVGEVQSEEAQMPFDLASGPLIRARIVRINAKEHLLLITAHHIVCDGWSLGVILKELPALYVEKQGGPRQLKRAMQFSEYARQQSGETGRKQISDAEEFWLKKFIGQLPMLELPTDFTRPVNKGYHSNRASLKIGADLYKQIKAGSAKCGATLFATLLAGFELLLHRLSNQEHIVIGVPAAGQSLVNGESLVGHCTSLLPLKSRLDPQMKFSEFLAATKREVMDAYEHQSYSFGRLVQKLNLPRNPSRVPLIEAVFNVDRVVTEMPFGDLQCRMSPNPKQFLNFDLNLNIRDTGSELYLDCDLDSDVFLAATVDRWLGHYQVVLQSISSNPEQLVSEVSLLSPEAKRQILADWNHTEMELPQQSAIQELVESQVLRTPGAVAVVHGNRRITYSELNARANQLARHLWKLGVGPDHLVGVCMNRSLEMIVGLLAVLKAGGAYVPLDPMYPKERIALMLEDADVCVLLTESGLRTDLPECKAQCVCYDLDEAQFGQNQNGNLPKLGDGSNLAYVIYTSGSTGRPKGVAIAHRSVVNMLAWAGATYTIEELSGVLASTSVCFDISVFEIFAPLSRGGKIILTANALQLSSLQAADEVTLINTVPSAMTELLATGKIPRSLRTVNLAGEPFPAALAERIYELPHVSKVYDLYGPTEDTVYATYSLRRRGEPANIGRPLANTKAFILDDKMQPVPVGVAGELHLGGIGLARCYLNRPELTSAKFVRNPFGANPGERLYKTGDLARFLPDGRIECLGRIDHQLKLRGFRIEPGEIESALREHQAVQDALVVSRQKDDARQLVAYVTPRNGVTPMGDDLRGYLRARLPSFMIPQCFVALQHFPLTANGKVDRKALPPPDQSDSQQKSPYVPPRNEKERILVEIWEEVLGKKGIGIHENIFEIGGDSLLVFRITNRVVQKGLKLKPKHFFQHQTVAELAAMAENMEAKNEEALAELRKKISQMSPEEVQRLLSEKKAVSAVS